MLCSASVSAAHKVSQGAPHYVSVLEVLFFGIMFESVFRKTCHGILTTLDLVWFYIMLLVASKTECKPHTELYYVKYQQKRVLIHWSLYKINFITFRKCSFKPVKIQIGTSAKQLARGKWHYASICASAGFAPARKQSPVCETFVQWDWMITRITRLSCWNQVQ